MGLVHCCLASVSSHSLVKALGQTNSHSGLFSWTLGELAEQWALGALEWEERYLGESHFTALPSQSSTLKGCSYSSFVHNIGTARHDYPYLLTTNPIHLPCSAKQCLSLSSGMNGGCSLHPPAKGFEFSPNPHCQSPPLVLLSPSSVSNLTFLLDFSYFWSAFATLSHVKNKQNHDVIPHHLKITNSFCCQTS